MSTITQPTEEQLYGLVESYLDEQPHGLAITIGYATGTNEFPAAAYVFGSAYDQYYHNLNLGATTPFELGSLSKTFTATLSAFLGQKYNPSWETQTIGEYNVNVGSQFHPIPLRDLANYTSGLPTDNGTVKVVTLPELLPTPYTPAAMLGYLKGVGTGTWKPTDIGKAYTYSNLAVSILAQLIPQFDASTSSQDFTKLMAEWVFAPLGMINSGYFGDVFLDKLPLGYSYANPTTYSPTSPGHDVFPAYYGGGGVVSTPNDMLAWLQFNMGMLDPTVPALGRVLKKTQTPSTKVVRPGTDITMGLGWFLSEPKSGSGTVFKDGGLAGCDTYLVFVDWIETSSPSPAGVFVLINADGLTGAGGDPLSQSIAASVLSMMLG
jgi:serine-type D-Ala-D-Ala carboxypeptidase/endopeptidase